MLASVVLFIMVVIWLTLTYYNQKTQDQYHDILQRYLSMNEVTVASQQMITDLNNYFVTPSLANLDKIYESQEKILEAKNEVYHLVNAENEFALTNYINLIDSFIETTNRSLMFHSDEEAEASAKEFAEATSISNYISEMTLTVIDKELKTYDRFYRGIMEQSIELKKLGFWLLLLI
ncbi:MAG: two-component sensor histidine kinase, partial [Paenisporosarcina sp.]